MQNATPGTLLEQSFSDVAVVAPSLSEVLQSLSDPAVYTIGTGGGEFSPIYLFSYFANGTCIGHFNRKNIGLTLSQIVENSGLAEYVDAKALLMSFVRAASTGGGWVRYAWADPIVNRRFDKVSYIAGIQLPPSSGVTSDALAGTRGGSFVFVGAGFSLESSENTRDFLARNAVEWTGVAREATGSSLPNAMVGSLGYYLT